MQSSEDCLALTVEREDHKSGMARYESCHLLDMWLTPEPVKGMRNQRADVLLCGCEQ
jgi:hypothetical protein